MNEQTYKKYIFVSMFRHHHQFLTPYIWERWVRINYLHFLWSFAYSPLLSSVSVQVMLQSVLICISSSRVVLVLSIASIICLTVYLYTLLYIGTLLIVNNVLQKSQYNK